MDRFLLLDEDAFRGLWDHTCLGVDNGVLVMGGFAVDYSDPNYDVFLLRSSKWTVVGRLNEKVR